MQKKKSAPTYARRPGPPQQVRIIGGAWKRTPLPVLDALGLRPTPDRVRETVFNWINHQMTGDWDRADCLDLFAGSGALGFEAASRGARSVTMIDTVGPVVRQLELIKDKLGYEVSVNDGSRTNTLRQSGTVNTGGTPTANLDNRLAYYARVQYAGNGKIADFAEEMDLRTDNREFIWLLGAAAGYESQSNSLATYPTPQGSLTIPGLPSGNGGYTGGATRRGWTTGGTVTGLRSETGTATPDCPSCSHGSTRSEPVRRARLIACAEVSHSSAGSAMSMSSVSNSPREVSRICGPASQRSTSRPVTAIRCRGELWSRSSK